MIKLSEVWREAVANLSDPNGREHELRGTVRLGLRLDGAGPAAGWVIRELSREAVQIDGLSVHDPREAAVRWTWPLQIGFLSDPESLRLMEQFRASEYGESLASLRPLQATGEGCDLLIVPQSLREAVAALLQQVPPIRASAVAVLGGTLESWSRTDTLRRALQEEVGAGAAFIATIPGPARTAWLTELIGQLSHNAPLDVALGRSVGMDPRLILFATTSILNEARLDRAALRLTAKMAEAPTDLQVSVRSRVAHTMGVNEGPQQAATVAKAINAHIKHFPFDRESGEAAELAEIAREIEAASVEPAPREPRYLQAQVLAVGNAGPEIVTDQFRSSTVHQVDVQIAATDRAWLMPEIPTPFPDHLLPPDSAGYELQVIFSEPRHLESPEIATVWLPREGPSDVCRFTFIPRVGIADVDARIVVLHENRVLQTALLRGPIASPWRSSRGDGEITLALEAVVHPDTAGLLNRSHFHAALVVNRNDDGAKRMLGSAGGTVGVMELDGIKDALENIRDRLSATPPTRSGPTKKPFTSDAVELLRFLAFQGRALYDGLIVDQFARSLGSATRIQIVSAKPDAFLPLEFVYDRASPLQQAEMCPNAVTAARTGECPDCPSLSFESESPHICPAGFWALTRVIERHAFDPDVRPENGTQYTLHNAPAPTAKRRTLQPLRSALYAASDRVDAAAKPKKLNEKLLRRLANAVGLSGGTANAVTTWADWKEEIKKGPTLLVVLSHTVKDRQLGGVGLEIAAGDVLLAGHIGPAHVAPKTESGSANQNAPLVLLLGCETGAPEIPYQGFVPAFRRAGAAAVVCTNSTVLGREVAPAAAQLIEILEEITERTDPIALGDALLELRRDCFARGMPMALGLVAYGDADWRLTR